jgi:hypothetical protein
LARHFITTASSPGGRSTSGAIDAMGGGGSETWAIIVDSSVALSNGGFPASIA